LIESTEEIGGEESPADIKDSGRAVRIRLEPEGDERALQRADVY